MEAGVVGNEQVNARRGRAGQLDGVGRTKGTIRAQCGVKPRGSRVKGDEERGRGDDFLILPAEFVVLALEGLDQNPAGGEGGRQELIAAGRTTTMGGSRRVEFLLDGSEASS
jgi:hypothetical protein